MNYPVTISSPIPPPPQAFSNIATLFTSAVPDVVSINLFLTFAWPQPASPGGQNPGDPIPGVPVPLVSIPLVAGVDYTRSAGQITMTNPPPPGSTLTAQVFTLQTTIDGAAPQYGTKQVKQRNAAPIQFSSALGQISGVFDGTNTKFGLVFPPSILGVLDGVNAIFTTGGVKIQRARIYLNGLLMTLNYDVSFSGQTMVFLTPQIPQPTDLIFLLGWL